MRRALFFAAVAMSVPAFAASETPTVLEYHGQQVPDAIALRWLARSAESNSPAIVSLAAYTLGVDPGEASGLVTQLADLHRQWASERDALVQRIGCNVRRPWPTGAEAYRIWDLLDEANYAVDAKYLALAKSDLGSEGFAELERLLSEFKEGMHIQLQSAEAAFNGAPSAYASETLMTVCEGRR